MPPLSPPALATPPARLLAEGVKAQARVELNNAVRSLTRVIGLLREVGSDEARAALSALKALERVVPDVDEGVSQSEVKSLLASAETAVPGPGGAPRPGAGPPMGMGLGPMPPRALTVAGMPMGMNQPVPTPG